MSYYNSIAPTRLGMFLVRLGINSTLDTIAKHNTGKAMLEIGPGRGILASEAIKRGYTYDAVSMRESELSIPGMRQGYCLRWPTSLPEKYDVIIATHVIEHTEGFTDAIAFVEAVKKHLNPGGVFFVSAPDCRYGMQQFYLSDYTHQFVTNIHRVANLLTDNGYEILDARLGMCGLTFPWYLIIHIGVQIPLKIATRLLPMGFLNYFTDYKVGRPTRLMKLRSKIPECRILATPKP